MRKYTFAVLISYILGALAFNNLSFDYCFSIFLILIIAALLKAVTQKRLMSPLLMGSVIFIFATLFTSSFSDVTNKSFYPLIGQKITLKCQISDVPYYENGKMTYIAKMISAETENGTVNLDGNISISSYCSEKTYSHNYNDIIEFETTIKTPKIAYNDGNFDYNLYMKSKNIFAVCYTEDKEITSHGKSDDINRFMTAINTLKKNIIEHIDAYLEGDTKGFVSAFVIDDRSLMSDNMVNDFKRTGLFHVIAISGQHLSILILFINKLLSFAKLKKKRLTMPIINILVALFVMSIVGFSPSIVRSAIMIMLASAANIFFRESDSLHSISIAALIILIINPLSIYSLSFVLSFASVLGIILLSKPIKRQIEKLRIKSDYINEVLAFSIAAQIATLPITVVVFNSVSLLSLPANVLILPFIPFFLAGCILMIVITFVVPALASVAAFLVTAFSKLILFIIHTMSSIPFAYVQVSGMEVFRIMVIASIIIMLVYVMIKHKNKKIKVMSTALIICVICSIPLYNNFIKDEYLTVTYINVGQGDSTLIETPDNTRVLIDGGGGFKNDTGNNILIPYLYKKGITKLDYAIVSHFDDDHAGGIITLLGSFKIDTLIVPDTYSEEDSGIRTALLDAAKKGGTNIKYFMAGKSLNFDNGIVLNTISPKAGVVFDGNNSSLVQMLTFGDSDFLFVGDIEIEAEQSLLDEYLDCEVLKVAHHGSKTSTSKSFVEKSSPDYAIISVGENNMYKHPSNETIATLEENDVQYFRTDINGTITIKADKKGIRKISVMRDEYE